MNPIKIDRVIIADSQFLVVGTVTALIGEDAHYQLCGVAGSKQALLDLLVKAQAGLLITDPATIDCTGPEDLGKIKENYPQVKILVLTNFISKSDFLALSKLGIKNIAYKNVDREEFFAAVQATVKGKKFYSEELIDLYLDPQDKKPRLEESRNLTSTEIGIVRMIADGLSTKEIAVRKHISHHTVSTHRKNIFRKVEVSSASELIIRAIKSGWIDNIEYYI